MSDIDISGICRPKNARNYVNVGASIRICRSMNARVCASASDIKTARTSELLKALVLRTILWFLPATLEALSTQRTNTSGYRKPYASTSRLNMQVTKDHNDFRITLYFFEFPGALGVLVVRCSVFWFPARPRFHLP